MNPVLILLVITVFHWHNPPQSAVVPLKAGVTLAQCQAAAPKLRDDVLAAPDRAAETKDVQVSCVAQIEGNAI
jgi:hypothetical protein